MSGLDTDSMQFTFHAQQTAVPTQYEALPRSLRDEAHWLVADATTKAPVKPRGADPTNTDALYTFSEAVREADLDDGEVLACQFSDTPFVGIDIDDVAEDFHLTGPAEGLLSEFAQHVPTAYAEWSTSGTGMHLLARGELADTDRGHRADLPAFGLDAHLEIYEAERYFIVTGQQLAHEFTATLSEADAPSELHEAWVPASDTSGQASASPETSPELDADTTASVSRVRRTLEAYAGTSHGLADKATETLRRWDETPARAPGDRSSEHDASFVAHLYFWCKGDTDLVDACWQQSARYDQKAERDDYRARTIAFVQTGYTGTLFQDRYVN